MFFDSLNAAARELGFKEIREKLKKIVPDISKQYSAFQIDTPYLETKVRNMHAFQVLLIDKIINEFEEINIVDIGDSAGTHLQYLKGLYSDVMKIRCLSVNLDSGAIDRIKSKGLEAIHSRAEDLGNYSVDADVFLCFEMIEHLMNPTQFLYDLSVKTKAKYLILTVPYLSQSRVGLHPIRLNKHGNINAENTHIFELCPKDWELLFRLSGWRIDYEQIYLQYPKKHYLRAMKHLWKKYDFEGFYGVRLVRDHKWSSRYLDWA